MSLPVYCTEPFVWDLNDFFIITISQDRKTFTQMNPPAKAKFPQIKLTAFLLRSRCIFSKLCHVGTILTVWFIFLYNWHALCMSLIQESVHQKKMQILYTVYYHFQCIIYFVPSFIPPVILIMTLSPVFDIDKTKKSISVYQNIRAYSNW